MGILLVLATIAVAALFVYFLISKNKKYSIYTCAVTILLTIANVIYFMPFSPDFGEYSRAEIRYLDKVQENVDHDALVEITEDIKVRRLIFDDSNLAGKYDLTYFVILFTDEGAIELWFSDTSSYLTYGDGKIYKITNSDVLSEQLSTLLN